MGGGGLCSQRRVWSVSSKKRLSTSLRMSSCNISSSTSAVVKPWISEMIRPVKISSHEKITNTIRLSVSALDTQGIQRYGAPVIAVLDTMLLPQAFAFRAPPSLIFFPLYFTHRRMYIPDNERDNLILFISWRKQEVAKDEKRYILSFNQLFPPIRASAFVFLGSTKHWESPFSWLIRIYGYTYTYVILPRTRVFELMWDMTAWM